MKFRVTITFQTAEKMQDDAEFVFVVDAENADQAVAIATNNARRQEFVGSEKSWHFSTESLVQ